LISWLPKKHKQKQWLLTKFPKKLFFPNLANTLLILKLTAFGGTFLATLPIFAIITNSS